MDKADADAELTRLQRAERAWHRNQDALRYKLTATGSRVRALTGVTSDVGEAISRRVDTRGDAFAMTVDGVAFGKRHDAGVRLKHALQRQLAAVSADGGGGARLDAPVRHGQLGGFDVTGTVQQVLGAVQVTLALDGVPEAEIRLAPDELRDADPVCLVTRLENRLTGLEALKRRILSDIGRLGTEVDRARDDLARPFPQAHQLADARDRVKQIDEQLEEAAKPPRPDDSPQLTQAVPGDSNGQAPGHDLPGGEEPGRVGNQRPEAVTITRRDFPDGNPRPGMVPATLPAAARTAQSPPLTARPAR